MNIKEEVVFMDDSDSNESIDEPPSKKKVKDDPDWEEPDVKPKTRRKVKAEPNAGGKVKAEPNAGGKAKAVKKEVAQGEKPKRTRKVKTELNGEAKPKPKPRARASPKGGAKQKVGRPKKVKDENDDECLVKSEKRKVEEDVEEVPLKKLKFESAAVKPGSSGCSDGPSNEAVIVAHNMNCSVHKADTLINMLTDGATIPFLIRYRKNIVGSWSPADMRMFKELYQNAKEVVTRAASIKNKIAAKGHLNEQLTRAIDNAWTMAELDDIYEPYKPAKTPSKLSILRDLGLEPVANQILDKQFVDLMRFVDAKNEHTKCLEDVKVLFATAIVETMLSRMKEVERLWKQEHWKMGSSKIAKGKVEDDKENFKKYYDFKRPAKYVRSDEVLALNRGAKKKILKVSLIPNEYLKEDVRRAVNDIFKLNWLPRNDVGDVLNRSAQMAVDKMMTRISRKIRSDCTRSAEVSAIEVFNMNLKRLLLTPPFRSDREFHVLGIDPGKRNGCKTVIVNSKTLNVEENVILHLFSFKSGPRDYPYEFEWKLKDILRKWGVEIIVIGNGVGCQEVETVVNDLVRTPEFSNVRYTIVPEQGVSVYSCSQEAQEEYPDFKPEVVSALSLVKRFFNPLHEYVKVNPKNLGVGMYQHDIDDKKLTEALQETVSEIVSVVGVDLNAASLPMLKSIAGLTETRAKAIIAHRNENGPFRNRKELLKIKGIGPKTFQQCAGFVRIIRPADTAHRADYNLLDQTIIHPEHYSVTQKLLKMMYVTLNDIGTPQFIAAVRRYVEQTDAVEVSEKLSTDVETIKLLFHALSTSLNHDVRTLGDPPEFRSRLCSIDQLRKGMVVSGRVDNVTTFGAFVDIGVGVSGLLHYSHYNRCDDVGLGDRIEVVIDNLEVNRERIGLSFRRKISDLFPMNKLI